MTNAELVTYIKTQICIVDCPCPVCGGKGIVACGAWKDRPCSHCFGSGSNPDKAYYERWLDKVQRGKG